jgi:trigger factor
MIVTRKEGADSRHAELTIAIDRATWVQALQSVYEKNSGAYPVEGFEAGSATREALEQAYGEECLYQEAVNETFPPALVEAVTREGLKLAGAPELSVLSIGPEGYTFSAVCELYPEVTLGPYKGVSAPMEKVEISDDDAQEAVASFLRAHKRTCEVDGPAAMGDTAVIDYEGFVDGTPFEGGKAEQYPLSLGSGSFIPGFEEQVAGMRAGEERDIHVTFPENYMPPMAGKEAVFHIRLHRATRGELPELTEAFAKENGYDGVEALRQSVILQLVSSKQQEAQDAWEDALVQKVIASLACELPEGMVRQQLEGLVQEVERQLQGQQVTMEEYLKALNLTEDSLREQLRPGAEDAVKYELTMEKIAQEEALTVSPEELEERYGQMTGVYGMSVEDLRQQIPPEVLTHDLRAARARAIIISNGKRS